MTEKWDYFFKYIMVGDAGVGKTSLMRRYTTKNFPPCTEPTIAMEFGNSFFQVDDSKIRVQIWDTSGQEVYYALTQSYFRGAVGAVVVFDLGCASSLAGAEKWVEKLHAEGNPGLRMVVVGNKSDTPREVDPEQVKAFVEARNLEYFETSGKSGDGVDQVFELLTKRVLEGIAAGTINPNEEQGAHIPTVVINEPPPRKKWCCFF